MIDTQLQKRSIMRFNKDARFEKNREKTPSKASRWQLRRADGRATFDLVQHTEGKTDGPVSGIISKTERTVVKPCAGHRYLMSLPSRAFYFGRCNGGCSNEPLNDSTPASPTGGARCIFFSRSFRVACERARPLPIRPV